jgi:hypothetical protein
LEPLLLQRSLPAIRESVDSILHALLFTSYQYFEIFDLQ